VSSTKTPLLLGTLWKLSSPCTTRHHLLVVSAQSNTADWLAACVGTALGVTGTKTLFVGAWGADQGAVLGTGRGLKCALRLGSNTSWLVRWADDAQRAWWGAECALNTGDGYVFFLGLAGVLVWITVVGAGWGRAWAWAWGRAWAWAWGRAWGRTGAACFLGSSWVTGALGDTAHVGSTCHVDVTLVTPCCAPGVLDLVVVLSVHGSVTYGKYTVVQLGSAPGVVEYTRFVHLECWFVGFDGNGDWVLADGGNKGVFVHFRDVDVAGDGDRVLAGWGRALSVNSLVWEFGVGADTTVLDDEVECVVHQTTLAAVVDFVAVYQVLFGQGDQVSGGDLVCTFDGTGGGEGPAGTALALVFDWGYGTLLRPVDAFWGGGSQEGHVVVLFAVDLLVGISPASVHLGELGGGQVGELVVAYGVGVALLVVFDNKGIVGGEGAHGFGLFFKGLVDLAEFTFPGLPLGLGVYFLGVKVNGDTGHKLQVAGFWLGGDDRAQGGHNNCCDLHDELITLKTNKYVN